MSNDDSGSGWFLLLILSFCFMLFISGLSGIRSATQENTKAIDGVTRAIDKNTEAVRRNTP